jgi:hypothetical protein
MDLYVYIRISRKPRGVFKDPDVYPKDGNPGKAISAATTKFKVYLKLESAILLDYDVYKARLNTKLDSSTNEVIEDSYQLLEKCELFEEFTYFEEVVNKALNAPVNPTGTPPSDIYYPANLTIELLKEGFGDYYAYRNKLLWPAKNEHTTLWSFPSYDTTNWLALSRRRATKKISKKFKESTYVPNSWGVVINYYLLTLPGVFASSHRDTGYTFSRTSDIFITAQIIKCYNALIQGWKIDPVTLLPLPTASNQNDQNTRDPV